MYLKCAKKIKSVLLCTLFCQGLTQASDWQSSNWLTKVFGSAPDQIIRPYEPSLVVRYPQAAAVCGVTTTFFTALQCSNSLIVPTFLGCLMIRAGRYWLDKPNRVVDLLLIDPVKLHAWSVRVRNSFEGEKNGLLKRNSREWMQAVKDHEEENPIFLLHECDTAFLPDVCETDMDNVFICSMGCALSRSLNPQYRTIFEDRIVKVILSNQKTNTKPFWWVSFGCGGLFQKLVTLFKLFTRNPTVSMRLDLIDLVFFELMMVFYFIQSKGEVHTGHYDAVTCSEDSVIHDAAMLKSCFASICEQYPQYLTDKKDSRRQFKKMVCYPYALLRQFVSCIKKTFPLVTLSLFIHNNTDTFLASVQDKEKYSPDLVTAVDIEDSYSLMKGSTLDYAKLCIGALKANPFSHNFWLAKKGPKASVLLCTIALEGEEEHKIENKKLGCTCYLTEEVL